MLHRWNSRTKHRTRKLINSKSSSPPRPLNPMNQSSSQSRRRRRQQVRKMQKRKTNHRNRHPPTAVAAAVAKRSAASAERRAGAKLRCLAAAVPGMVRSRVLGGVGRSGPRRGAIGVGQGGHCHVFEDW